MHKNSPFSDKKINKISGKGARPPLNPSPSGEGDTPSPHSTSLGAFGTSALAFGA